MPIILPAHQAEKRTPRSLSASAEELLRARRGARPGVSPTEPRVPQRAPDPHARPTPRNSGEIPVGTRVSVVDHAYGCCYLGRVSEGVQWEDRGQRRTRYMVRLDNGTVVTGSDQEVFRITSKSADVHSAPKIEKPGQQPWVEPRKPRR